MKTRAEVIIVLSALATIAVTGTWAILYLIYLKAEAGLLAIASGIVGNATGAIAAVLSQTGRSQATINGESMPIQAEITNTSQNPVPTEPQSPLQPSQTAPAPVEQVSPDDALPEPPPVAPRN